MVRTSGGSAARAARRLSATRKMVSTSSRSERPGQSVARGSTCRAQCPSRTRWPYGGRVQVAARTEVGHVRSRNEDALLVAGEDRLLAVCDGLGGHPCRRRRQR